MKITKLAKLIDGSYMAISAKWQLVIRLRGPEKEELSGIGYGGKLQYSAAQDLWYWTLSGKKCVDLLNDVRDYLGDKRQHADVMLEFDRLVAKQPKLKPFQRLSDEALEDRLILRDRLIRLHGGYGVDISEFIRKRNEDARLKKELIKFRRAQVQREKERKASKPRDPKVSKERRDEGFARIFKEGVAMQYTELMEAVRKEFGLGVSTAKKQIRLAVEEDLIFRIGAKQSPKAFYMKSIRGSM